MRTIRILAILLGFAIFLSGFPTDINAQGRSRRALAAGPRLQTQQPAAEVEERTGHWIQYGSIDGPHPLYSKKSRRRIRASAALREFQAHVDAGLPPPARWNDYRPVGDGPLSKATLTAKGLKRFGWYYSREEGEIWLGMRNMSPEFQDLDVRDGRYDYGYGPEPGYPLVRFFGSHSKDPQFYGGYEEGGIKACLNELPVVWIWIWDKPKPEVSEPEAPEPVEVKCPVGTRERTDRPPFPEVVDGITYTVHEFWDGCNYSFDRYFKEVICDPNSWYIIAEHGRSQGKLGKNFRVHEAVTTASKQKNGPMDEKKEVETDPQRIAEKQRILWDILRKDAPDLENDDKIKYLLVLVACSPDGSATRVKVVWFKDGWHWKEFFIGLAIGIVIGYFIPRACPPDMIKDLIKMNPGGSGNAPTPPPNFFRWWGGKR